MMGPIYPDLENASVFITGGGSGIGAALTEGFLAQGAKVAFVQRSDASEFVERMAQKYDNTPLFMPCDITDTSALLAAIKQAETAHGPVTVLVNNAANDNRHATLEVEEEHWEDILAINLKPYFFAAKAVIPGMQSAGGGAIVNFSSVSYLMGMSGIPVYVTANAGISGMTRALAREFGPNRIRVNSVVPGWVLTDRQKDLWVTEEALSSHLDKQCLPDALVPEDITGGVLYLASSASRAMTGQSLVIDGGVVVTG